MIVIVVIVSKIACLYSLRTVSIEAIGFDTKRESENQMPQAIRGILGLLEECNPVHSAYTEHIHPLGTKFMESRNCLFLSFLLAFSQ